MNSNYRSFNRISMGIRKFPINALTRSRHILQFFNSLSGFGSLKLMAKLGVGVLVLTGALSVVSAIYHSRASHLKDTAFIDKKQIENKTDKSILESVQKYSRNNFSEQEIFTSEQSDIETTQNITTSEIFQQKLTTINYTRENISTDAELLIKDVGIKNNSFTETPGLSQFIVSTSDLAITKRQSEQVKVTKSPVEKPTTDTTLFEKPPEPTLVTITDFENITNNKIAVTEENVTVSITKSSKPSEVNISKTTQLVKVDQLTDHTRTDSVVYLDEITKVPLNLTYTSIGTHGLEENLTELEKSKLFTKPSINYSDFDSSTPTFTKSKFTDDEEPIKLYELTTEQLKYDPMYLETTETIEEKQTEFSSFDSKPTEDQTKSPVAKIYRHEHDQIIINHTKATTINFTENITTQSPFISTKKLSYSQNNFSVTIDHGFYLNGSLNFSKITDRPKITDLYNFTDSVIPSTNNFSETESGFLQVPSADTNEKIGIMQEKSTNKTSLIKSQMTNETWTKLFTFTTKINEFPDKEVINETVLKNDSIKDPQIFKTEIFNVQSDIYETQKPTTTLFSDFKPILNDLNETQLVTIQVVTKSVEDAKPVSIKTNSIIPIKHPHYVKSKSETLNSEEMSAIPKHDTDLEVRIITSPVELVLEGENNNETDTPKSYDYMTSEKSYTTLDHSSTTTFSSLVSKVHTKECLSNKTDKKSTYMSFSLTMCNFIFDDINKKTAHVNEVGTKSKDTIKFESDYACKIFKNISESMQNNHISNQFYTFKHTSTSKLLSTTYYDQNETEKIKDTDINRNKKNHLHKYSIITKENLTLKRKCITKHKPKKLQTRQYNRGNSNVRYIISDHDKKQEYHKTGSSDEDDDDDDDEEEEDEKDDSDENKDNTSDEDDSDDESSDKGDDDDDEDDGDNDSDDDSDSDKD